MTTRASRAFARCWAGLASALAIEVVKLQTSAETVPAPCEPWLAGRS
eukprot:CAMPEP_0118837680 /NCGR_PEP_ID=MMETSP1162-20130426/63501_1 /TAXON_ID=33656 /ORGANISM="Phaeocystis Sp, Strain CCMP2710" /LENGTH=46 /DNA_ID= /DNA_START= /DNA_END= /DNA_ORIENTATION=